jgi:hypothetical protein
VFVICRSWANYRRFRFSILTAYTIHALSSHSVTVFKQLGHNDRFDFFYSLVPRTVFSIILPLCFIYPILSISRDQRPRVRVIPAVSICFTLIFSSIVVVLDRGVTYGESRTLEYLELAQACVVFFLHKRLRHVPFEGYWRALYASLFLFWLPPFQRLLIRFLPLTVPHVFVDTACLTITVSEVKDGLCAVLVILEALVFSSWFLMFSLRDKSIMPDTEAAETVEPETSVNQSVNEKEKLEAVENAIESQNKSAQAATIESAPLI